VVCTEKKVASLIPAQRYCILGRDIPVSIAENRVYFTLQNSERCTLFAADDSDSIRILLINDYSQQTRVKLTTLIKAWNLPTVQPHSSWEESFPQTAVFTGEITGPARN
jgi:hypothetical protein